MWIKHHNNRIAVYVPDAPEQGRAEVGDSNLYVVSREAIMVPSMTAPDCGVGIANMSDGTKRALRNLSSGGYIVKWRNGRYELNTVNMATEVNLHKIQVVEPAVTGWFTVHVEINDDDIPIING